MKPITFSEQSTVAGKGQEEYQPLPALKKNTPNGELIACWKGTWRERLRFLVTGRMWVSLLTFNQKVTPSFLTTIKSEVI